MQTRILPGWLVGIAVDTGVAATWRKGYSMNTITISPIAVKIDAALKNTLKQLATYGNANPTG